jgi:hypothetical protein
MTFLPALHPRLLIVRRVKKGTVGIYPPVISGPPVKPGSFIVFENHFHTSLY